MHNLFTNLEVLCLESIIEYLHTQILPNEVIIF